MMFRILGRLALGMMLALSSLAIAASGPASAAPVTIGQLGGTNSACQADLDLVQTASSGTFTVPAGTWNVTSWSTQAGTGSFGPFAGSLQLEMWRPTATPSQYALVGISPVVTTTASGLNTFSLGSPIAVQGGDLLGLRNLTNSYGCADLTTSDTVGGAINVTAPAPGDIRTLPAVPEHATLNITADLVQVAVPTTLQVKKVVSGPSTTGFVEHVNCTAPAITSAATTTTENVDLPFNADGSPDTSSPPAGWTVVNGTWQNQDPALVNSTCTVTETVTGGATSVSYSCAWTAGISDHLLNVGCPGVSSGPSTTPASVTFEGNGDTGVLTVTNTFPAATPTPASTPAPAIVVAPKFTG